MPKEEPLLPAVRSFQTEVRRQLGFRPLSEYRTNEVLAIHAQALPAIEAIRSLRETVLSEGEYQVAAAIMLADLGRLAAEEIRRLWVEKIPANGRRDPDAELILRQEVLRAIFAEAPIPTVHTERRSVAGQQKEMVDAIIHGPKKRKGLHKKGVDGLGWYLAIVNEAFKRIRLSSDPIGDLEIEVSNLPPLNYGTRKEWAALAAKWLLKTYSDELVKGTQIWRISNAERFRRKDQARRGVDTRLNLSHFRRGLREVILERYESSLQRE